MENQPREPPGEGEEKGSEWTGRVEGSGTLVGEQP